MAQAMIRQHPRSDRAPIPRPGRALGRVHPQSRPAPLLSFAFIALQAGMDITREELQKRIAARTKKALADAAIGGRVVVQAPPKKTRKSRIVAKVPDARPAELAHTAPDTLSDVEEQPAPKRARTVPKPKRMRARMVILSSDSEFDMDAEPPVVLPVVHARDILQELVQQMRTVVASMDDVASIGQLSFRDTDANRRRRAQAMQATKSVSAIAQSLLGTAEAALASNVLLQL
ncbi:hypothetical protein EV122DRAFT_282064 [Schizophyllum commune]